MRSEYGSLTSRTLRTDRPTVQRTGVMTVIKYVCLAVFFVLVISKFRDRAQSIEEYRTKRRFKQVPYTST